MGCAADGAALARVQGGQAQARPLNCVVFMKSRDMGERASRP